MDSRDIWNYSGLTVISAKAIAAVAQVHHFDARSLESTTMSVSQAFCQ